MIQAIQISVKMALAVFIGALVIISCGLGVGVNGPATIPAVSGATGFINSDGSLLVTISGTGFVSGPTVTVNGTNCTGVNVLSSTTLTCTLPNADIPLINIVVTNPGGSSNAHSHLAYQTLFVTSTNYLGDFGAVYGSGDGIAAANSLCVQAASSGTRTSSLGGTWRSILSDNTHDASALIQGISGIPLKNANGDTLLTDASNLWGSGGLDGLPQYDENGAINFSPGAWTGTKSTGLKDTKNCSNWGLSTSPNGNVGGQRSSPNSTNWISAAPGACNGHFPLYCINTNN